MQIVPLRPIPHTSREIRPPHSPLQADPHISAICWDAIRRPNREMLYNPRSPEPNLGCGPPMGHHCADCGSGPMKHQTWQIMVPPPKPSPLCCPGYHHRSRKLHDRGGFEPGLILMSSVWSHQPCSTERSPRTAKAAKTTPTTRSFDVLKHSQSRH